jgi:RecA/RadA recombinase
VLRFGPGEQRQDHAGAARSGGDPEAGSNCVLIDAEHPFAPECCAALGVNMEDLVVCQPDSGDMALQTADHMFRSAAVDLIVVDSVSALVPKAELEMRRSSEERGRKMERTIESVTRSWQIGGKMTFHCIPYSIRSIYV